jgi:hypothetical protein
MGTWWTISEEARIARAKVLEKAREAKRLKALSKIPPPVKPFLVTERTNERTHTGERRGLFGGFIKPKSSGGFLVTEARQEPKQPISFLIPNAKIQKKK